MMAGETYRFPVGFTVALCGEAMVYVPKQKCMLIAKNNYKTTEDLIIKRI